jgi:hypothetical protein
VGKTRRRNYGQETAYQATRAFLDHPSAPSAHLCEESALSSINDTRRQPEFLRQSGGARDTNHKHAATATAFGALMRDRIA